MRKVGVNSKNITDDDCAIRAAVQQRVLMTLSHNSVKSKTFDAIKSPRSVCIIERDRP